MTDIDPDHNRDTFRGRGARIKELEEQVDRLKQKLLESEQTKGVLCDKCGWSMKFPGEDCRCELEQQVASLQQKLAEVRMTEDEMASDIGKMSDEEVTENVRRVFGDDLAKRAVKCKAWRWMPGMLCNWGRVLWVDDSHAFIWEQAVTLSPMPKDALPDLTDPATLGCLLHLVREHWGDCGTHAKRIYRSGGTERWICTSPNVRYHLLHVGGESEAESLVSALELEVNSD